jgi:hypothetical protein
VNQNGCVWLCLFGISYQYESWRIRAKILSHIISCNNLLDAGVFLSARPAVSISNPTIGSVERFVTSPQLLAAVTAFQPAARQLKLANRFTHGEHLPAEQTCEPLFAVSLPR